MSAINDFISETITRFDLSQSLADELYSAYQPGGSLSNILAQLEGEAVAPQPVDPLVLFSGSGNNVAANNFAVNNNGYTIGDKGINIIMLWSAAVTNG